MKSMTGFGRGECVQGGTRYSVEISTVNRRNAELVFSLPRELGAMENLLRDTIAPAIVRGRATITASVSSSTSARSLLDPALFRRLQRELTTLQRTLRLPGTAGWPELVRLYAATVRDETPGTAPDSGAFLRAARAALRHLDTMRRREGNHLRRELGRLLGRLARETAAIRRAAPGVVRDHHAALRARLAKFDAAFAADDERLARELALFADRSDITEELSRLESHITQFRAGLAAKDANGRALDFLAQEMFRECNTIGAKANSAEVTRRVIAAKTELERLREQVQNIE